MMTSIGFALLGGVIIGLAVTLMLWLNGRVTGISGIVNGALSRPNKDSSWRWAFVLGLVAGGFVLFALQPSFFENTSGRSITEVAVAGFLVGFGTILGSGCTSGHGVCGISRFSIRSLVATSVFIGSGMLMATLFRNIL